MSETRTINVRQKTGLLGRSTIRLAWMLSLVGVRLPMTIVVWAINNSTFVSIDGEPWRRLKLDLTAEECS